MDKTSDSLFVDDDLGWHAAQLEYVDFLSVALQNTVRWVRQTDKGQLVRLPVHFEGIRVFRSNDHNFCFQGFEFRIILTQLRHMPLAERSQKAAVENQQNIGFVFEIRKRNFLTISIHESKLRCNLVKLYSFCH